LGFRAPNDGQGLAEVSQDQDVDLRRPDPLDELVYFPVRGAGGDGVLLVWTGGFERGEKEGVREREREKRRRR
jgi:hypothetical protein